MIIALIPQPEQGRETQWEIKFTKGGQERGQRLECPDFGSPRGSLGVPQGLSEPELVMLADLL